MYKVKIISQFSAAHFLRGYKGKCENLHGHNWKVEVIVSRDELGSLGMAVDFQELKKLSNCILEELDHRNLNEIEYFKQHNPSSEEIAKYIFSKLKEEISKRDCKLERIKVWEADNSCAIYQE